VSHVSQIQAIVTIVTIVTGVTFSIPRDSHSVSSPAPWLTVDTSRCTLSSPTTRRVWTGVTNSTRLIPLHTEAKNMLLNGLSGLPMRYSGGYVKYVFMGEDFYMGKCREGIVSY